MAAVELNTGVARSRRATQPSLATEPNTLFLLFSIYKSRIAMVSWQVSVMWYSLVLQLSKLKSVFASSSTKSTATQTAAPVSTAPIYRAEPVASASPEILFTSKYIYGSYGCFPLDVWSVIIAFLDVVSLRRMLFVHPRFVPLVIKAFYDQKQSKSLEEIKKLKAPTNRCVVPLPTGTFSLIPSITDLMHFYS